MDFLRTDMEPAAHKLPLAHLEGNWKWHSWSIVIIFHVSTNHSSSAHGPRTTAHPSLTTRFPLLHLLMASHTILLSCPSFLNTCIHFMANFSILTLTGYSTWHHQVQAALLYVPPQPPVQQASFWLMSSPLTQLWSLWIRGSPNSLEDLVPHAKYILYKNRRMGLGERGKVCVWCQEKWEARTLGRLQESRGRQERARGRKDCAVLGSEQKDRHVPGNRWRKMVGDLKSSCWARGCWCLGGQMAQSGYHS